MTESVLSVVCDAGPIIHLDELNSLPLLADFDEVLIPEQVWQEVEQHRPNALANSDTILHNLPTQSTWHIRPSLLQEIIARLESQDVPRS
jgi:predicted nucleic acid-binding protein